MRTDLDLPARTGFALSVAVIAAGAWLAVQRFPQDFDWHYHVVSALASRKHNPAGAIWFAGAVSLAMILLWPVTTRLRGQASAHDRRTRGLVTLLRVGLVGGMLVGLERAIFFHLSDYIRKGHEALALLTFLTLYAGVLGLYVPFLRRRSAWFWPAVAIVLPLLGVGISELLLYLDQREIGWADHDWRTTGIPFWLSFAFWQWLAVATLGCGFGGLALLPSRPTEESARANSGAKI